MDAHVGETNQIRNAILNKMIYIFTRYVLIRIRKSVTDGLRIRIHSLHDDIIFSVVVHMLVCTSRGYIYLEL